MAKAIWNGAVPAEAGADAVRIVEGNVYFPPESVDHGDLRESKTRPSATERAARAITTSWSTARSIPTLHGFTLRPNRKPRTSQATSRSGKACRSTL